MRISFFHTAFCFICSSVRFLYLVNVKRKAINLCHSVEVREWKDALMKIIVLVFVFSTSGYWRLLAAYKSLSGSRD
jgi:hypothetical protein